MADRRVGRVVGQFALGNTTRRDPATGHGWGANVNTMFANRLAPIIEKLEDSPVGVDFRTLLAGLPTSDVKAPQPPRRPESWSL